MASLPDRKRFPLRFEVVRTEQVSPHVQRVVLGGEDFAEFIHRSNGHTDSYVKLLFAPEDADYAEPWDMQEIRELPAHMRPVTRTYTVRFVDQDNENIAIDVVTHGDDGLAGPWAAKASPGDAIRMLGPGGAFSPEPEADWYLFAGDESALPAICVALESLPASARARVFIEVDSAEDEHIIRSDADASIIWLHRGGAAAGTTGLIADAITGLDWPDGRVQAFVHGEAGLLKALRSHFLDQRGIPRGDLSISGYWRRGDDEQRFREWTARQTAD